MGFKFALAGPAPPIPMPLCCPSEVADRTEVDSWFEVEMPEMPSRWDSLSEVPPVSLEKPSSSSSKDFKVSSSRIFLLLLGEIEYFFHRFFLP